MKITFIGTGYVGLVSGVMMSHLGHDVTCLDLDSNKISQLKNKKSPIYEPDLEEYIERYAGTERLQFSSEYNEDIRDSDCLFITVGTPPKENGDADLSGIFSAIKTSINYIKPECLIIIKSTVPPSTCDAVKRFIQEQGKDFEIASNPEFLREGSAIGDFLEPDRIIVGASSEKAFQIVQKLYKPLTDRGIKLVETDLVSSELIKYASNSFLATKIAFINEIADLCEKIGADIGSVSKGIGLDTRIGERFLQAGPGFGGSCFPKDILAMSHLASGADSDCLILDSVISANNNRPSKMILKISDAAGGNLKNKNITILGLTYKAGTDDLRESPAIPIIRLLSKEGAKITAYDPKGTDNAKKYFDSLNCASSIEDASEGADIIVIATEWLEFKKIDWKIIRTLVKNPVIVDLRNILK
ncbi:UDP-glucose/GDP-mannose dehydrogenase family protein, partial [Rickettsiaceae bacterium]|nr:UDP-glucose/GDP-mannose dehydrogenase family protein [Rickettsiaceae bacterium]